MIIRPPPFSLSLCFAALFDCEMKLGRLIRCFLSRLILLLSRRLRRVPLSLSLSLGKAGAAKLERQITVAASAFKHISGSLMWNRVRLRRPREAISFLFVILTTSSVKRSLRRNFDKKEAFRNPVSSLRAQTASLMYVVRIFAVCLKLRGSSFSAEFPCSSHANLILLCHETTVYGSSQALA